MPPRCLVVVSAIRSADSLADRSKAPPNMRAPSLNNGRARASGRVCEASRTCQRRCAVVPCPPFGLRGRWRGMAERRQTLAPVVDLAIFWLSSSRAFKNTTTSINSILFLCASALCTWQDSAACFCLLFFFFFFFFLNLAYFDLGSLHIQTMYAYYRPPLIHHLSRRHQGRPPSCPPPALNGTTGSIEPLPPPPSLPFAPPPQLISVVRHSPSPRWWISSMAMPLFFSRLCACVHGCIAVSRRDHVKIKRAQ